MACVAPSTADTRSDVASEWTAERSRHCWFQASETCRARSRQARTQRSVKLATGQRETDPTRGYASDGPRPIGAPCWPGSLNAARNLSISSITDALRSSRCSPRPPRKVPPTTISSNSCRSFHCHDRSGSATTPETCDLSRRRDDRRRFIATDADFRPSIFFLEAEGASVLTRPKRYSRSPNSSSLVSRSRSRTDHSVRRTSWGHRTKTVVERHLPSWDDARSLTCRHAESQEPGVGGHDISTVPGPPISRTLRGFVGPDGRRACWRQDGRPPAGVDSRR